MQRWVIMMIAGLFACEAQAGGFTIPGQGTRSISRGAAFVALADDLTALSNNPAGLSKLSGTRLLYNHNVLYAPSSFTRVFPTAMEPYYGSSAPDPAPVIYGDPSQTVENTRPVFPLGAMLAVASDFGLDDWTFAMGVYGPNAMGAMAYDVQGGSRYMLTEQEMILVYYTLGAAYGGDNWGVGATVQWAHLPVTKFSLVIDGTAGGTPSPYNSDFDLQSTLDLSDAGTPTAQLGVWYRPISQLELGASARIVPVSLHPKGKVILEKIPGQVFAGNVNTTIELDGGSASLDLTLPIIVRAGLRYIYENDKREVFDVELDYVYEAWSSINGYDIKLDGTVILGIPGTDKTSTPLNDLNLGKAWKDTHSLRLGGTWNAIEDLFSVSAGGFWESGATPTAYAHLDFPSFQRFGIGGGIRLQGYGLDFNVAYMHVFSESKDVSESQGKVFQQRPLSACPVNCNGVTGVPANAGHFETSYNQLTASLGLHFDAWMD